MNKIQYTIRSIPPNVDAILRHQARQSGKSFNEVVVGTLAKGTGVTLNESFSDLDWFIGNKSLNDSFGDAQEWLAKVPKDIK